MDYRLTRHAEEELIRRGINRESVDAVLREPQQIVSARVGDERRISRKWISVVVEYCS